jgi:hypothetical protein
MGKRAWPLGVLEVVITSPGLEATVAVQAAVIAELRAVTPSRPA